jgi:hypothetical protein
MILACCSDQGMLLQGSNLSQRFFDLVLFGFQRVYRSTQRLW